MNFSDLQQLKVQCLIHANHYALGSPEEQYWWNHYVKLSSLIEKVFSNG